MSLRAEQRDLTRRKVLGAVLDLVADGSLDELSVPEVSRRSGVSVATIYRYFPTKDELIAAAAEEPARQAFRSPTRPQVVDDDELVGFLRTMWTQFGSNLALLRHQVASPAGRELRRARTERSRQVVGEYLERSGIDPESAEGRRLVALILLVSGSLALLELHDRQGHTIDESIDHAAWAMRALIEATERESAAS